MANYFYLDLDTTAPSNVSLSINSGAVWTTDQLVELTISTSDSPTTGYMMKIWGNVDINHNPNILATEEASNWITFNTSVQTKLSTGDGSKQIFLKIRDDVYNPSSQVTSSINLNTTLPEVTVPGPSVSKISKMAGKNEATFNFTSDSIFTEYKVKVVSNINDTHNSGTQVVVTNGSTNMSGTGTFPASTPISCKITGSDLELSSSGDGQKIIKVFVKNQAGVWSS